VLRDSAGSFAANVVTAIATSARYADLAEVYSSDEDYEPGTVIKLGGNAEITQTTSIEDLNVFQTQLESAGVKVLRPEVKNLGLLCASPDWTSDGYYSYCPRDSVLVIGNTLIETPMPLRSRYFETLAYKKNYGVSDI
jgi:hypothetical protein